MKRSIAALALVAMLGSAGGAEAAGCLKGAIVGGIVGHLAHHHTLLGALGGCIIGHHEAAKHDQPVKPAPAKSAPSDTQTNPV